MRTRSKIGIALLLLIMIGAATVYWLYQRSLTYSFAPNRPEQTILAREHAECTAFYILVGGASQKTQKGASGADRDLKHDFEFHAKMSYNYSPDKRKLDKDIDKRIEVLKAQMDAADKQNSLKSFLSQKIDECVTTSIKSNRFIKEELQRRVEQK
ncbi:hypothetical protein [Paucimonas lemoignei]|nr:hypothetical protein [Paucimonas lemoignei]